MNTTKSFLKEVLARMKGDQVEVTAQKNYRDAVRAVEAQIQALEQLRDEQQDAVDQASENLNTAKFPSERIGDKKAYVRNIKLRYEELKVAQDAVVETAESLDFFKNLLAEYNEEVPTATQA